MKYLIYVLFWLLSAATLSAQVEITHPPYLYIGETHMFHSEHPVSAGLRSEYQWVFWHITADREFYTWKYRTASPIRSLLFFEGFNTLGSWGMRVAVLVYLKGSTSPFYVYWTKKSLTSNIIIDEQ